MENDLDTSALPVRELAGLPAEHGSRNRREFHLGAPLQRDRHDLGGVLVLDTAGGMLTHGGVPSSVPIDNHSGPPPHAATKAPEVEGYGNGPRYRYANEPAARPGRNAPENGARWYLERRRFPLRAGHLVPAESRN